MVFPTVIIIRKESSAMRIQIRKLTLAATAAAFLFGSAVPAFAQTDAASTPPAQDAKAAKSQARKAARAQRKAERKAARAKNTAELKKLEDAGYKPAANDPNYPQNLQNAEKKAAGASQ